MVSNLSTSIDLITVLIVLFLTSGTLLFTVTSLFLLKKF